MSVDGLSQLSNGVPLLFSIVGVVRNGLVTIVGRAMLALRLLWLLLDVRRFLDFAILYSRRLRGLGSCWGALRWGGLLACRDLSRLGRCYRLRVISG